MGVMRRSVKALTCRSNAGATERAIRRTACPGTGLNVLLWRKNLMPMLRTLTSQATLRRPVWVSADTLNVAPDLLGAPLASPLRRLTAIGLDLLIVAVLSKLDGFWLAVALVVFLYQMRTRDSGKPSWLRNAWIWGVCGLCLWLAAETGWQAWTARQATPQANSSPATQATAQKLEPIPERKSEQSDADRIAALEDALAEARKPVPFHWQTTLRKWWEGTGVSFGWAIVYFSLIPAWLRGQSLGKKLLGLRVVELTGKPLTVRACFSRYGGYAAGMATGMFGFAQILWDANRQSIQDKVAHTVVLDLRSSYRTPQVVVAPKTRPQPENTTQIALKPW